MASSKNLIQSLRSAHDPHYKLEGRVGQLEKGLGIEVAQLHKTLSTVSYTHLTLPTSDLV